MAERRLKRGRRLLAWTVGALVLWFGLPLVARRLDFFRIRRVEVHGIRYLDAREVIAGLELKPGANLFDNLAQPERRLRAMPGVVEGSLSRRPPGVLRVIVTEATPVALFPRGNRMRAVDADGRVLPFDAAAARVDLPVVRQPDSLVTGLLARIRDVDATLYGRVVQGWRSQGDVVIQVDKQRYWFRPDAPAEVIRAVRAVAQDLARKGRAYQELDARFAGYVVVRRTA
jgi:cell division septal protein FtsQ